MMMRANPCDFVEPLGFSRNRFDKENGSFYFCSLFDRDQAQKKVHEIDETNGVTTSLFCSKALSDQKKIVRLCKIRGETRVL